MPRRPPAQVRVGMQARQAAIRDGTDRVSQFPGLSPRGRAVLAGLESTRLWPRAAEQALRHWQSYQRDPYARQWDRPDSCGDWHCCPDIDEVTTILRIVVHNLPPRDARRLDLSWQPVEEIRPSPARTPLAMKITKCGWSINPWSFSKQRCILKVSRA